VSIWNSFKKKVNETWSGADFWDKDENQRQRQQFAAARQPVTQPTSNTGGLRVTNQPSTQTISIDQPDYSNRMLTVDAPPVDPVNAGLNAGKSWEQISKETGGDLQEIAAYSRATRPNYGVARMEKPQQSNWNKFRDVLDANTDADKYRRQEQNDKRGAAEEEVPITWERPGNVVGNTVGAIPKMFNTAGNQIVEVGYTAQQQFATAEYSAATENYTKAVKSGDPRAIALARERADKAAQRVSDINRMIDATKDNYQINNGGLFNVGTIYDKKASEEGSFKGARDIVLTTGEGMLDVATLGMSSVTGKQVLKVGVKQAIKESAPTIAKVGIMNATQGGMAAARQDGDAGQIVQSALLSGTAGTVGDLALGVGAAGLVKSKNGIVSMLNTPNVKINVPEIDVPVKVDVDTPSVYQAVNPVTKEKIYKVIQPEDFDQAKVDIDGQNGIAGKRQSDGFVAHITAKSPADMEAAGFTNAGNYRADVDGVMTPAKPKVEVGKTQSLAELLPNIGDRKALIVDPIDELKKANPSLKPEVIDRLIRDYGTEKTRNIIASTSDATNIRDMNGFVISEARKRYGTPAVRVQGSDMSPEELASLEASAPPLKVETPAETPVRIRADGSEAPANPIPLYEMPNAKVPDAPSGKLGTMADEFYQSRTGNQRIKYRDLERLGQDISKQVDDEFAAIGTDFPTVARKVQEGARAGAKTLDEAGLTPDEAAILRRAQAEMNYVRRRASTGKREVGGGDYGELYIPQQKPGQYGGENLFEGFRADKPGSENVRKNRIELEDLDYSADVIGQYVTRYGDTKLYQQERLARALAKANPNADEEVLGEATSKLIAIQDKVNEVKTKINAFGFGLRQQVDDSGKFVDTAKEMTEVGKTLGHDLETILDEPKGLTNGDRINSISIDGQSLGDRLGLNQYRDAQTYAAKEFTDAGGDRQALADMVSKRLQEDYNLHPDDLEYAVGGISRIAPDVPDEVVLAKVTATYRNAAKQQLLEELQHVDIQNVKLRKDVSGLTNQILREGSIESELSNKVVSKILQTQNMIFRKLNVSSAINELSDLTSFTSVYGKNTAFKPDFSTIKEFGLGDIDAAIEPYIRQISEGKGLKEVLTSINDKTNLYKFVEHYKAAVVATSAKNKYMTKGLVGDELARKVLDDYRTLALPVDAFTKTFLDNAPLYTQYMTWGLRNIQKEGKLATGKISAGVLEDMSTKQRIARNAYANLPAKTVFWLSSNALKGTGILTAFGMTDFTGLTNQDYSGIAEEDKSWFDKTTQFTNSSTTLSMLNSIIQAVEKENLKNSDKYKDADYNPYETASLEKDILKKYTPSFIRNVTDTNDLLDKGYSENKAGRVQYEAPDDFWNVAKSYLFGKSQTDNARAYSGRESILSRDGNPITNVKDMAAEQIGLQDTNYTRPLTEDYSKAYKEADKNGRKAMLAGGRAYNKFLDDLKKDQPQAYDNYISALDGNHVSPEYWKTLTSGEKGTDLTAFNALKGRNKQRAKDLGVAYDPIYDLPDNQATAVLQQKATATGDDIALRNSLYKEKWYTDYMDKVKNYYNQKAEQEGSNDQTKRVVDWYALNDQYNGLKTLTTDDGKTPEWASKYPMVYQQKAITDKYGFDSQESKNFFKANGDAYKAEKANYDVANLDLINKMRVIEGYPPMSAEQYAQVTSIKNTDDKKSGSSSGGSNSVRIQSGDYGKARSLDLPSVKIQVAKPKRVAKYAPKTVKIKRTKAKM
jgi:hypothetical protein